MMDKRNENGTFAKGHKGGPGRPPKAVETSYLEALKTELTMDKWVKIVQRAIKDASAGDHRAREWLANYAIGRAPHIINLTAVDAAILADVLALLEKRGTSAGDLFNSMLIELNEVEYLEAGDDGSE